MTRQILGTVCGLALAVVATSAQADLIWSDDFDRPNNNTVGHGWNEIESRSDEVRIYNGYLLLKDYTQNNTDIGAEQHGISTVGYNNITVEFKWRPWDTESNDSFSLEYQVLPLVTWMSVFDTTLGGSEVWQTETIDLSFYADNISELDLRFMLDASYKKEGVKIKYINVYGDVIPTGGGSSVPEPATVGLFGMALLGLGLAARQRRRR
jgi:hypothetical protein